MQDTLNLKNDALLKASGAMTGGIGGLADTCGSMIGAALVLGSVYGRGRKDGEAGMSKLWESIKHAAEYYDWFKKEQRTVNCRDIVTRFGNGTFYDYGDPEQAQKAMELGITDKCIELVENNSARVVEMLWDTLYGELQ